MRPDSDCAASPLRHRDASAPKTFIRFYTGCFHVPRGAKVFLVLFFQKKNFFLYSFAASFNCSTNQRPAGPGGVSVRYAADIVITGLSRMS